MSHFFSFARNDRWWFSVLPGMTGVDTRKAVCTFSDLQNNFAGHSEQFAELFCGKMQTDKCMDATLKSDIFHIASHFF